MEQQLAMTDSPEKDIATATATSAATATATATTSLDDIRQQGVTIHIQLTEPVVTSSSSSSSSSSTQPPMAKATLVLYLYDKLLADAAATRLDSATCEINTTAQAAVNNGKGQGCQQQQQQQRYTARQ